MPSRPAKRSSSRADVALPCVVVDVIVRISSFCLIALHVYVLSLVASARQVTFVQATWRFLACRCCAVTLLLLSERYWSGKRSIAWLCLIGGAILSVFQDNTTFEEPVWIFCCRHLLGVLLAIGVVTAVNLRGFLHLLREDCFSFTAVVTTIALFFPGIFKYFVQSLLEKSGLDLRTSLVGDVMDMPEFARMFELDVLAVERIIVVASSLLAQWALCGNLKSSREKTLCGALSTFGIAVAVSRVSFWYSSKHSSWIESGRACTADVAVPLFMVGHVEQMPANWQRSWQILESWIEDVGFPAQRTLLSASHNAMTSPVRRYLEARVSEHDLPYHRELSWLGLDSSQAKVAEAAQIVAFSIAMTFATWVEKLKGPRHRCWNLHGRPRMAQRNGKAACLTEAAESAIENLYVATQPPADKKISTWLYPPGYGSIWHNDYFISYDVPYWVWLTFSRPADLPSLPGHRNGTYFRWHELGQNATSREVRLHNGSVVAFCSGRKSNELLWHTTFAKGGEVRFSLGIGLDYAEIKNLIDMGGLKPAVSGT